MNTCIAWHIFPINGFRFIRKQGLTRTFYECDYHLWRVGNRTLPTGIRVDGGSDWICLNRKFISYLLTTEDELVKGLQKYYKFAILPAEVCDVASSC